MFAAIRSAFLGAASMRTDIVVMGGGLGGIAATPAAAKILSVA